MKLLVVYDASCPEISILLFQSLWTHYPAVYQGFGV